MKQQFLFFLLLPNMRTKSLLTKFPAFALFVESILEQNVWVTFSKRVVS